MRKGKNGTIFVSDGEEIHTAYETQVSEAIGINFGSNFCAEHEWGLSSLKNSLGITEASVKNPGLAAHTVAGKAWKEAVTFHVVGEYALLRMSPYQRPSEFKTEKDLLDYTGELNLPNSNLSFAKRRRKINLQCAKTSEEREQAEADYQEEHSREVYNEHCATAWSDRDFGILVQGEDYIAFLSRLYEKGCAGQLAVLMFNPMPGNPFCNAGLCFIDKTKSPAFTRELDESLSTAFLRQHRLDKAVKKSGIEKRLKKAGKGYYELIPEWFDKDDEQKLAEGSAYPFHVWLNPADQDNNNFCWCTVEDLEEWIEGKDSKRRIGLIRFVRAYHNRLLNGRV